MKIRLDVRSKGDGKGKEKGKWKVLWQKREKIAKRPSRESNLVPSANVADSLMRLMEILSYHSCQALQLGKFGDEGSSMPTLKCILTYLSLK